MFSEGKRFVFVKATESLGFVDAAMPNNVTRATAAGLRAGVYHFARPDLQTSTSGAVAEADHFLLTAGNFIGPGYLRPVLDLEVGASLGSQALTDWVIAFSDEIVAHRGPGAAPIIYCVQFYAGFLDSRVAHYDPWIRWIGGDPQTDNPSSGVFTNWSFWQYSATGSAGGINPIDLNVCNTEVKPLDSFLIPPIPVPVPPDIAVQPQSRSVKLGKTVTFTVTPTVSSSTPLGYQWRFEDIGIPGATARAYSLDEAQLTNSGAYTVVLTNAAGAVTSTVAMLTVTESPPPVPALILYQEDFDSYATPSLVTTPGTVEGFNLFFSAASGPLDFVAAFGHDYSTVTYPTTIPSAPHSTGGTTKGLLISLNKDSTAASAAVNLYPVGQTFSGNFALKFDLWLNYNAQNSSTTEHALCGINHSGTITNRISQPVSDGLFFAIDGDGGTSGSSTLVRDFGVFGGGGPGVPVLLTSANTVFGPEPLLGANFDNTDAGFAAQFPSLALPGFSTAVGSPGQQWLAVEIRQAAGLITWLLNDVIIAQYTNTSSYSNGNILLGYNDVFASIGSSDNFVLFDNVRVETIPDLDQNGLADEWEIHYFGQTGVDAALDPDGDRTSNFVEYHAGTNPTNAASLFQLLGAKRVDNDVRLDWTAVDGHSYIVQFATNTPSAFLDLTSAIPFAGPAEGTTYYLHPGAATNPAGFYRIRLAP